MNLLAIGHLVAEYRRRQGLTLYGLAREARVGRSTLAALEAGKLKELGYAKVARICDAVGLVVEARPMTLDKPLAPHRHLTDSAGRELTKAAIEDIVIRGTSVPGAVWCRRCAATRVAVSHDGRARCWQAPTRRIPGFEHSRRFFRTS